MILYVDNKYERTMDQESGIVVHYSEPMTSHALGGLAAGGRYCICNSKCRADVI